MPDDPSFAYDVFLSYSSKDKPIVRDIAERLEKDGVKVWFDEWVLPQDELRRLEAESAVHPSSFSLHPLFEEGLERSRVLVLCMSANAFGSDWAQLESGTFRFRDPLNKERRFLPLRLDNAPIKGSLAQFLYINWRPAERELEYAKLVEACHSSTKLEVPGLQAGLRAKTGSSFESGIGIRTQAIAFRHDGKYVCVGSDDGSVRLWDIETGQMRKTFTGHTQAIWSVLWSRDGKHIFSGGMDSIIRLWDTATGKCIRSFDKDIGSIRGMSLSSDDSVVLSVSEDSDVRIWDVQTGRRLNLLKGHQKELCRTDVNFDSSRVASSSFDGSIKIWNIESTHCLQTLKAEAGAVFALAFSPDARWVLSGSTNGVIRLWNADDGRCLRVFEGHTHSVNDVSWSSDNKHALSCSDDQTVRLWDVQTGRCVNVFKDHVVGVITVAWSDNGRRAFSGDQRGGIRVWDLSEFVTEARALRVTVPVLPLAPDQVQYTNAKVLLVGESGAGKTGLSKRLALNDWHPSDSTVGAWATQWKLPVAAGKGVEREIWLWDFGGQADQRLIHQLYMDETALAVLVFDGQKEDLFETLGQWDRDLTRAARKEFAKLLVAGRVDAGGLRASRSEVEKFATERKFRGFLETSAKRNLGCEDLKQAILDAIPWDELPCRTTEVLFKRLKEEIIALKDEGRVLMRFNELRETLQLRLSGELARFADEELRAVLTLLAGPGVVWELSFGSWVLLQPERINAYAQAVIRTLQADEHQRGCLMEERVLKGDLMYESSMMRLEGDEERFVLLAMHQTLVERGLCLRQPTTQGNLLVFPSYYRKERPDIVQYPAVQVNYRFTGFLDELYATLVVRLHHSDAFEQDELWRYAADFKTNAGKQLGIKLTRRAPGVGDLEVYFDPAVAMEEKIIFSKYVHEHLLQHARDVERLRHYVCPECGTPVGNREVAMKRLNEWLNGRPPETPDGFRLRSDAANPPTIICVGCEQRVPLWDEMEQCFASPEIQQRVRDMQEEANLELDNESKERALVGEVISTVALAAQISREKNVSDHGIDMEIEFKDDAHEATHCFIFLQLKSGDSYTRKRKKDGTEVFTIKDERHARYWMASPFPVLLVIRNSEGEVRWMEVRDYLKRASENGAKPVKQIVFEGERFDVMSVRRWRDKILGGG
ncbi:MAG: TIR domain-containing protein [Prosthecobacter sp.]|jgi:small GTP-binding protein|uniref:WD40 domain-containing protein n=1 Tax=Prosthecobacter sp. TaxID=1965333 RepID=UPI0019FB08C7|nr:DUF4365 domain-containing protein [Prosthecobacter sp.]MBE2282304.1 TIR domain-containing protein [Prosthecobacter sp.]